MKKIMSCFILTVILFTAASCAPSPVLKITDTASTNGYNVTDVMAEQTGNSVFITCTENVSELTVNRMNYDTETDTYTLAQTLLSMDTFSDKDALNITLDLNAQVPYIMIKYRKTDGSVFEQYIYKNSYDGKLWLLEREDP